MLLTLSTGSLRNVIGSNGQGGMTMFDVPAFTIKELRLHGLNIMASMLSRWGLEDLDKLRDKADKASCPCLVLIEDTALKLGDDDPAVRHNCSDRVRRLAAAANRLGCNALAVTCDATDSDDAFDRVVSELKSLMPAIEKLELNVLVAPYPGLTQTTEKLTSIIKRIGGFRIGSLPSFAAAAACGGGDPIESLRKLAPYAGAIQASIEGFTKKGTHKSYDLASCVTAVRSVGFLNTLAIDYTGAGDPLAAIETARGILQQAIDSQPS
jgi:hypothetical protein